jgi:hypothetical protein
MSPFPVNDDPDKTAPVCWICNRNEANSGEHKTKRSDLLAVLGTATQAAPFYYHDLERLNRPVGSLDAKILKSPVRICADCNTARTQPHDSAWERMSDWLRTRQPPLAARGLVRGDRIFRHYTRREMKHVHLFFLKLFGCMISEAKAIVLIEKCICNSESAMALSGEPICIAGKQIVAASLPVGSMN